MLIKQSGQFALGYTPVVEIGGKYEDFQFDFGILRIKQNETFQDQEDKECVYHLLGGKAQIEINAENTIIERQSMLEEPPTSVHVSCKDTLKITAQSPSAEFAVHRVINTTEFEPKIYFPKDVQVAELISGSFKETTKRSLRTVLDDKNAPYSKMTTGELVNHAGRWSCYPPHYHPHPELYHYRMFPENGFGYSEVNDTVYKVTNRDTVLLPPNTSHPQVAAPGYTMIYVWMIPHLEGDRFGENSRIFEDEHAWTLEKG
jgi:5-deoxy-glucuronate isomerase